ncbi:MAG TPA: 3'-5' exonuclease [Gemmatimonadales bacterium]|nr:3'-5' exonuclease [Gemmatimonadales bacterium]
MRDVLGIAQANRHTADRIAVALLAPDSRFARTTDGRWTLVTTAAASPALDTCRFAVVDVETTGTRARRGDRIIEIAAVIEGQVAFHTLVNPGIPIPPFVATLTGISDAQLREAPSFDAVVDGLLDALRDTVFVAHNARFDWAFVTAEVERARGLVLHGPRVCTLRLARRLLPDLPRRNLDTVADHFGITIEGRHRAVGDAVAAARVLEKLVGIAKENGAVTLGDLLGIGYRVPGAGSAPPDTRYPTPGT